MGWIFGLGSAMPEFDSLDVVPMNVLVDYSGGFSVLFDDDGFLNQRGQLRTHLYHRLQVSRLHL